MGVKLNAVVTGLAVAGSPGVKVKLLVGKPTADKVTVLPASTSNAFTEKLTF